MTGVIYLVTPAGLLAMESRPYELEAVLQQLLERDARLLGGTSTGESAARRWILVGREQRIQGASGQLWSADHVFVDDEGVPTVVEVKRSSNTQIRREIVGQLLDYAANLATSIDAPSMRLAFEARAIATGREAEAVLQEVLGIGITGDEFWSRVGENLAQGRIRGYFVADEIPDELRRIVEYLNRLLGESRFLALEVRQFQTADASTSTLVPQIVAGSLEPPAVPGAAGLSDLQALQLAFWTQFRDMAAARGGVPRMPKPSAKSLVYLPSGRPGVRLVPYILVTRGSAGVELQLHGPGAVDGYAIFERHRDAVGARLDALGEVRWIPATTKVSVTRASSPADPSTWPPLQAWLADALAEMAGLIAESTLWRPAAD